jgi:hypothetical protein
MLFYRAALPLSSLNYAAGVIRRHLKAIGSRWRKLNSGQEALLVLAYLRKGETFGDLAAGLGVGRTTAWRYVNETVELPAVRAPKLRKAIRDAKSAGHAYSATAIMRSTTSASTGLTTSSSTRTSRSSTPPTSRGRHLGSRLPVFARSWHGAGRRCVAARDVPNHTHHVGRHM